MIVKKGWAERSLQSGAEPSNVEEATKGLDSLALRAAVNEFDSAAEVISDAGRCCWSRARAFRRAGAVSRRGRGDCSGAQAGNQRGPRATGSRPPQPICPVGQFVDSAEVGQLWQLAGCSEVAPAEDDGAREPRAPPRPFRASD
eukprot:2635485-Pyramimonas_sp.AAC.1